MYVCLPFLFAIAQKTTRQMWPLLALWAVFAAVAGIFFPRYIDTANVFDFVPNFIPGVIAYAGYQRRRPVLPAWCFAILLFATTAFYSQRPGRSIGWICCLLIGLLLPLFREASWLTRSAHLLARYSYGIYLLHMWALSLAFYYLPLHRLATRLVAEFASLAVLAPAAYHLIEKPMISYGARLANRLTPERSIRTFAEENPAP